MVKIKKIFKQAFCFFVVSGIGWCLDFGIFIILTKMFSLKVSTANMISSVPAITYVFIMSNKKIFKNNSNKINLKTKYAIYFGYQILLVTLVSCFGDYLFKIILKTDLSKITFLFNNMKIVIKILITPITMTINFVVMKCLIEKI